MTRALTPFVERLVAHAARGELLLLVGAGASRWAGLPAWREAVCELARELVPALRRAVPDAAVRFEPPGPGEPLSVEAYLKIAAAYRHVCGEERLVATLGRLFDSSWIDAGALPLHRLFVELADFVPAIYTTNFDPLIERAFAAAGRSCQVVAEARDLHSWQVDRVGRAFVPRYPVYKLHGTLERPRTLVLGETDYHRRTDLAANALDLRFCSDVVGRALLLVGYSFSDPNLRWLWTKLRDLQVLPTGYFIELGESSDLDIAYFEKDQMVRVDLRVADRDDPVELLDFLGAVLDGCRREVAERAARQPLRATHDAATRPSPR